MKRKTLLFLMLMALFAPLAMNGQTSLLTENFDSMSSISTSYSGTGWFAYNAGSGNNWSLNSSSTYAHSSSNSAQYSYNSSSAANCYLVSAPFSVSSNMTELSVSLWEVVRSSSYSETFEVFFVKASDVTNAATVASATHYSAIASASYSNTSFVQKTGSVTNSALKGQSVRVVVHCTSAADQWNLYIDDITIMETTSGGGGQGSDDDGCAEIGTVVSGQTDYTYGPVNDFYNYSYYQIIYPKAEVPTGNITSIGFNYAYTSAMTKKTDVTIYMGTTSSNVSDSWVNVGTMTKVYTGNLNCTQQGWNDFTLTTPYAYTGAQNLIVVIMDKSGAYDGSAYKFNYAEGSNAVNKYAYADNSSYITFPANDTGTPTTTSASTGTSDRFPVTRFCAEASTSCPAPTNLTATNLTPTSATLNWEGDAESYNVRYRVAAQDAGFFDDFENGLGNWTLIVNAQGTGWQTFDATQFEGGTNYSGNYVAMARSYENGEDITADNWMISSKFTSLPNTMTYWAKNDGRDDHLYDETYDVCVSTNTNSTSNFVIVQTFTTTPNEWSQITIDLSAYAGREGYIAFHHHDAEKDMLLIDDILIGSLNTISVGEWIEASTTNNFINITGLSSETTYEFQVQANCGTDGISGWSDSETFTTPDACTVPTGLTAEVMGIAANLSWTGVADTYNVQYREVDPTAPATIILNVPTDIWNDGSGYQLVLDADHNTYGTTIPTSGNFTAGTFASFEYTIPENAVCSTTTNTIVVNGSVSITIPAGVYDYVFLNPDPNGTTYYIASSNGFSARGDDYEFQAGKTYEFTLSIVGSNDYITPTITDNGNAWTTVNGVTSPYMLENLSAETTYEFQVQGAGCDNWSASAYFTTGIAPYEITASANPTVGGTVAFMTGAASTSAHTHLPLDSYRDYSFSQQIYTPEEVGGGAINSISLFSVYGNLNDDGINYTRNLDVYLVHTSKTEFSSTSDWISVTNADKVFSGNVEFICGEWNTINFTTPFNYNGTSNLALIIADNTSESAAVGNYLECRTFEPSSGVYCSLNDDTQFNPSSPSGDGERLTQKNQILVNGSATRTFPEGATCTLVATPNTDYRFVDWTENDEQASTDATYSFTVTGDRNLVANFEPNSHTVTIVPNNTDYGSVSQGTVLNVPHGATITTSGNTLTVNETTVTANPAQATGQYTYAFSDWSNVPATVTENVTITANFTQTVNSYTVTIEPNDATYGSVSQGSVTSVPYGTTITTSNNTLTVGSTIVTATPQASTAQYTYAFSSWSNVPETVTGNVTITANFTQTTNSYTLTLVADPTAGGTVSGGGTYNYGEEVTITATANDGYTFASWSDNGAQSHTVTITGDATYTATFTQNEYTLTLTADPTEGGMLSASPTGPYHYNDVVEVTATPNDGFNFGSWSDGGEQTHTVTITGNTSLTAYFGADHTLTTYVNPIEGGYVTIAENQVSTIGAVTVGSGTGHNNQSPFASNTQYSFVESLYLQSEMPGSCTITSLSFESTDGTAQSNEIEVYMMNVDKTSFTGRKDFVAMTTDVKVFDGTWTVSSAGWNTIILDTPFEYDSEKNLLIGIHEKSSGTVGSISFRMTENTTGSVLCWDNDNNDDMNPTDLNDLKASNHTQEKLNYRANVRLGFGTYHNGQSVTLTAHANEGYQFVNWTENDIELGTNDTYTVSMTEDRDYTIYANFERLAKRFITAGNWDVANNWSPAGAPEITEDVYIEAAATIPSGCVATANEITINGGSITIADGGQLQHNNTGVSLTAQKEITGYTETNAETNWNYYLFSSPVTANATYSGIETTPHYDLYSFNASADPLEWIESTTSNLAPYTGFIYASRTNTTINVTGTVPPSNTTPTYTLDYTSGRFIGWNLIGNPFVCNAYVTNNNSANIDYYVLNHQSNYDEFVTASSSDPVAPLSALMVQATAANQSVTYSRTVPSKGAGILNIDVNRTMDRSTTLLDRARVRFGEGEGLQKFQFNPNHTKVYIPEGDKDFAVYYADGAGTIPVNFKAEDNGRYTLDFSTEEIGFNYLHLIDNRNGNDVDLLQTPYYAFDAKSTDFASRFTLVFATGNDNDGNFAFFNNGVWIINNDGKAELQVVDALGRILSSETISGSCSKAINAAPGVYMLRLINGNDVKVQKIVVRR